MSHFHFVCILYTIIYLFVAPLECLFVCICLSICFSAYLSSNINMYLIMLYSKHICIFPPKDCIIYFLFYGFRRQSILDIFPKVDSANEGSQLEFLSLGEASAYVILSLHVLGCQRQLQRESVHIRDVYVIHYFSLLSYLSKSF